MFGFWIILGLMALGVGFTAADDWLRSRRLNRLVVVKSGVSYSNNFHVPGVGYYHVSSSRWHPFAWNEFREGRGYYWSGEWHSVPDQRMVPSSEPDAAEINRVNQAWRDADPTIGRSFSTQVERDGFGTAMRRKEGS